MLINIQARLLDSPQIENPEILAIVIMDESGKDQSSTGRLAEEVFYGIVDESLGYVRQY